MSETGPIPPGGSVTPTPPPQFPGQVSPGAPLNYAGPPGASPMALSPEARTWGMLCHLAALAALIGIPFGHVLGPLIVWLIKKNEIPFVDDQGKESLNFQLTVALAALLSTPLICTGIGIIVPIAIVLVGLVFAVIGAVKSNSGIAYRYPWALRMI